MVMVFPRISLQRTYDLVQIYGILVSRCGDYLCKSKGMGFFVQVEARYLTYNRLQHLAQYWEILYNLCISSPLMQDNAWDTPIMCKYRSAVP